MTEPRLVRLLAAEAILEFEHAIEEAKRLGLPAGAGVWRVLRAGPVVTFVPAPELSLCRERTL